MNANYYVENQIMATPLKSVLITDWSPQHLSGHDLDGGKVVSYDIDTTIVGTEALGYDQARWSVGDIATLRIDAETQLAQLRIVTAKKSILRVREFQIVDIEHTVNDTQPQDKHGRHIFLKGTADNGLDYLLPMLGYTAWTEAWNLANLQEALTKAQTQSPANDGTTPPLSCEMSVQRIDQTDEKFASTIKHYKDIFYPDCKDCTPLNHATSLTTTVFTVRQTGDGKRAAMFVAAFIKKTNLLSLPGTAEATFTKRGTAFSPPYFKIDGEKVFIRTSSDLNL